MKSILLSIQPKWVEKILNGEKTREVRLKFPIDYVGWVYIYCTKRSPWIYWDKGVAKLNNGRGCICGYKSLRNDNGKIVARFWCDKVEVQGVLGKIVVSDKNDLLKNACLSVDEINKYLDYGKSEYMFVIHISDLQIFDKPKELREFKLYGNCWLDDHNMCKRSDCKYYIDDYGDCFCSKENTRLTKAPQNYCYIEVEE